jgi:hypothetical protein
VIGLAVFVRSFHVQSSEFPLGDGGLFLVMVEQLQANGYALPDYIHYNGLSIPFAYPPLGFYVTGVLADVTGATVLDVMRLMPLAASCATVVVVWAFARSVFSDRIAVLGTTFAFAVLPLSYRYFIMGSGITRSLGLLFAVTTIWLAYLLCTRRLPILTVPLAAAAGLTLMSHPNAAWFAAYSSGLVFLFHCRDRRTLGLGVVAAVGALTLVAPWLVPTVARHGVLPFFSASQSSNPGISAVELLLRGQLTQEVLPILGLTAGFGVLVCARESKWWLPVWLLAACVLDTRYQGTFAMVPVSLLVGAAAAAIAPLLTPSRPSSLPRVGLRFAGVAAVALFATLSVISTLQPGSELRALPASTLGALRWVADSTPPRAGFLVVAPAGVSAGSESEWFPALAERRSLGAYQGKEWLQQEPGPSPWERYRRLQACGSRDVACLESWARETSSEFDYVLVREAGTERLRESLLASAEFTLAYRAPDVWIFSRTDS